MKCIRILSIFCICFCCLCTMASAKTKEVKEYVKTVGSFQYTYRDYKDGVWLTNISPVSGMNIEKLEIPDTFDGKKVIKLGDETDDNSIGGDISIFGVDYCEGAFLPRKTVKAIKKIKHIILPEYLKEMTLCALNWGVGDGKTLYIPAGLKQNVIFLSQDCNWKSIDISPDNKWFKVKNQCLLSKSGDKLYTYFGTKTKVKIPNGVKSIQRYAFMGKFEEIFIPESVRKFEWDALNFSNPYVLRVSKKSTYLGLENNCVYNKKTGRLVVGCDENGIITIPRAVTIVDDKAVFNGNKVRKIIFPETIKEIGSFFIMNEADNLQLVLLSSTPPEEIRGLLGSNDVISVPRGSRDRYEKAMLDAYKKYYAPVKVNPKIRIDDPTFEIIERPYVPHYKFVDAVIHDIHKDYIMLSYKDGYLK